MLLFVIGNSERKPNPIIYPLYLFLSGSTFSGSFTDPDKKFFNVKSVFKLLYHGFSISEIYRFISFLEISILLFIKQCPLKFVSDNI